MTTRKAARRKGGGFTRDGVVAPFSSAFVLSCFIEKGGPDTMMLTHVNTSPLRLALASALLVALAAPAAASGFSVEEHEQIYKQFLSHPDFRHLDKDHDKWLNGRDWVRLSRNEKIRCGLFFYGALHAVRNKRLKRMGRNPYDYNEKMARGDMNTWIPELDAYYAAPENRSKPLLTWAAERIQKEWKD